MSRRSSLCALSWLCRPADKWGYITQRANERKCERFESIIRLPTTDYATRDTAHDKRHSTHRPNTPSSSPQPPTNRHRRLSVVVFVALKYSYAAVHTLTLAKHTKTKRCLPSSLLSPSPPSFPTHLLKAVLKLLHSPRNGSTTLLSCVVDPLAPLPLLSPPEPSLTFSPSSSPTRPTLILVNVAHNMATTSATRLSVLHLRGLRGFLVLVPIFSFPPFFFS